MTETIITIPARRDKGECDIEVNKEIDDDFLACLISEGFLNNLDTYKTLAEKANNISINLAEEVFNEVQKVNPIIALGVLGWAFEHATKGNSDKLTADQLLRKLFEISDFKVDPVDMPNTQRLFALVNA